jgi:hypothetical protein
VEPLVRATGDTGKQSGSNAAHGASGEISKPTPDVVIPLDRASAFPQTGRRKRELQSRENCEALAATRQALTKAEYKFP